MSLIQKRIAAVGLVALALLLNGTLCNTVNGEQEIGIGIYNPPNIPILVSILGGLVVPVCCTVIAAVTWPWNH